MTKRYYISRRLGDGTHAAPYTSELRTYLYANWPNEPHFLQQVIAHIIPWCVHKYDLSQVAHDDVMENLTGIFSFPEGALDRRVADISQALRTAIRNKLDAIGFDYAWITNQTTIREILANLFHSVQLAEWANVQISAKNFDLNKTVADIPVEKRQLVNQHLQDLGVDTSWIIATTTIKEIVARVQQNRYGSNLKRWFYHDEDIE